MSSLQPPCSLDQLIRIVSVCNVSYVDEHMIGVWLLTDAQQRYVFEPGYGVRAPEHFARKTARHKKHKTLSHEAPCLAAASQRS
jgi:hypothetical protein